MDEYDVVLDELTNALQRAGRAGIARQDVLAPLIDFLAATSLIMGGESAVRAAIVRLEGRIEEWKAGLFPAPGAANDDPS